MFADPQHVSTSALLQGDIVGGIQLLGAINVESIRYSTRAADRNDVDAWIVPGLPKTGHAMVLSHSCEIDPRNRSKLTSVILAPIRDASSATDEAKLELLIASNLIDQSESSGSFLKYFYLEPMDPIPCPQGSIVDFSKCFSVRNKCYEFLLGRKVLELNPDVRDSMSLKLALYFHRRGTVLPAPAGADAEVADGRS